jgi:prepilin-type N-terminal cleavage/methylation domain-containing protein
MMITNNKLKKINQKGFTLAEVIVVTLLVGIFAAMGTPNYFVYLAKQRLNDTNEQLYSILISTQERAKKENLSYTVELKQNALIPQYRIYAKNTTVNDNQPSWQNLAQDADQFKFVLNYGSKLIFDYQGKIDNSSEIKQFTNC